jgi:hypothetical protein
MHPSSLRKRKKEGERRTKQNAGYSIKKKNYPQSEFLERRGFWFFFPEKKNARSKSIVPPHQYILFDYFFLPCYLK